MRFERDDAKIGLLVFFAVAVFIGLLFHRSLTAIVKKETTFRVSLDNATDIAAGTEVQLQGLRVGQVNAIELKKEGVQYSFTATFGILPEIVLWEGTKAVRASKGLGGTFLDLQLPPPEQRTQVLVAGSTLPSEAGASIGTLMAEAQTFLHNLNQGVDELRGHLRQKGLGAVLDHPQVHKVLVELDGTLKDFRKVAAGGDALMQQGGGTLQSLDRSLAHLEKVTGSLQTLLDKRGGTVDDILVNLASVLKQLDALSTEMRGFMKTAGPDVDANLKALHRNLQAAEELIEILKAKPNRIVWGTPSKAEKAAARQRVEEKTQQDQPPAREGLPVPEAPTP